MDTSRCHYDYCKLIRYKYMQVQDASRRESFTESKTLFDRRNLQAVLVCVLICARSPSVQVCPMFLS